MNRVNDMSCENYCLCESDVAPSFDSAVHSGFIYIFEFAAHRNAICQACDSYSKRLDKLCQVKGRSITFNCKVGGNEEFLYPALLKAFDQWVDLEVFRSDAIQRREGTVQHMIAAFERTAALNGHECLRFLYNTDQALIPPRVATEGAGVLFCDVKTDRAEPGVALQV